MKQQPCDKREGVGVLQGGFHHETLAGEVAVGFQIARLAKKEVVARGVKAAAKVAESVLFALRILRVHNIIALGYLVDQFKTFVRRGLAVVVQTDDDVPARTGKPGHQRAVLPKVAAEIDKHDLRILFAQPADYPCDVVGAAVVDEDDFVVVFRCARRDGLFDLRDDGADGFGAAVAGHHEGK